MKPLKMTVRNAEFQIISALRTNRTKRSKEKEVFVEGTEAIKQLITARWEVTRILYRESFVLSSWAKDVLLSFSKAKQFEVKEDLYLELSEKENPSELLITAKMNQQNVYDLSDFVETVQSKKDSLYLLFDRPSDFGNFGSILRSCDAFQVDFVFLIGHSIDVYDPKVIRSSLGALFHTKLVFVNEFGSLVSFVENGKKRNGLTVIGSDSSGGEELQETKIECPTLFILGNERKGMSINLQALCDKIVRIPMMGVVNSLNVASAASIFLWELAKLRKK
ncbi:RNA methyltransferase, TrmH family [Leptospira yanagawae serovar Saopaulo str. Sao Paulo = ATCC 700523]|uniref:RNA methyltransferase, TrmH family n=2 Tax=Leptospira yanagawae TaxID=293069 RepID=A0A5E8H9F8_9LEPT|nr:RNA methyltransferase, TrmH family [Leptospira yanagawae serovar Saopaulo str. Sao Paulo = ATCC 700523]